MNESLLRFASFHFTQKNSINIKIYNKKNKRTISRRYNAISCCITACLLMATEAGEPNSKRSQAPFKLLNVASWIFSRCDCAFVGDFASWDDEEEDGVPFPKVPTDKLLKVLLSLLTKPIAGSRYGFSTLTHKNNQQMGEVATGALF